jgi:hypothetical protein
MKRKMQGLSAQLEARKKMFGLFSNGLVDAETANKLTSQLDMELEGLDSSDSEDDLKEPSPQKVDAFGESEQRLDATLQKGQTVKKPKKAVDQQKKKVEAVKKPPSRGVVRPESAASIKSKTT